MVNRIVAQDIERIASDISSIAPKLSGKTIVVTGGAGFLGRYIVLTLKYLNQNILDAPCKIIVLDNYITGLKKITGDNEQLHMIEHDITVPFNYEGEVDFIIHAAGIASPIFYKKYKVETIKVGTFGTHNMLDFAKEKGVKSFLLFSSSEVYGDPDPNFVPTPETYLGNVNCIGPRACYDESKRLSETLGRVYFEQFGVPVKMIRPFNIYGPGMRYDDFRVVPNFVVAAMIGKDIPVYGAGDHTRTFCYISDAITGIFQVLLSEHNGEAFNIGNDTPEITMKELGETIAGLFGNKVKVQHMVAPVDAYKSADPNRRCPILTKISEGVGYKNRVELVAGLKRFIDWAEEEYKDDLQNM